MPCSPKNMLTRTTFRSVCGTKRYYKWQEIQCHLKKTVLASGGFALQSLSAIGYGLHLSSGKHNAFEITNKARMQQQWRAPLITARSTWSISFLNCGRWKSRMGFKKRLPPSMGQIERVYLLFIPPRTSFQPAPIPPPVPQGDAFNYTSLIHSVSDSERLLESSDTSLPYSLISDA